jgi:hypothetical protein
VSDLSPIELVIPIVEYAIDLTFVPEIITFIASGCEGNATSVPTELTTPPIDFITFK